MIVIKDEKVLKGILLGFHPILVDIVQFIYAMEGKVVITSGFRSGDSGVHGVFPCRGIDLRSWIYHEPERIVERVNDKWTYDPKRPNFRCAMLHKTDEGAMHIHLQTHPNTVLSAICT